MVKPLDLLPENKVLQQCRTPLAGTQAVLVFNRSTNIGCHEGVLVVQVVLRQELLSVGGSIAIVATVDILRVGHFPRHIRTGGVGSAHQPSKELQCMHRVDRDKDAWSGEAKTEIQ